MRPRDGLSHLAAGHTDPHSALGIGALGGALATKAAMQAHDIPGALRFIGKPAEKMRGVKANPCGLGTFWRAGRDAVIPPVLRACAV